MDYDLLGVTLWQRAFVAIRVWLLIGILFLLFWSRARISPMPAWSFD